MRIDKVNNDDFKGAIKGIIRGFSHIHYMLGVDTYVTYYSYKMIQSHHLGFRLVLRKKSK